MSPSLLEITATACFALAVLHTFLVRRIEAFSHRFPAGSPAATLFHFLAETEIVFGVWAAALFLLIASVQGSLASAVRHVEGLDFTEPKFVLVVMVVAAAKPVVRLAETALLLLSRTVPGSPAFRFYVAALGIGPLLGSLITEPAAMTLLALLLRKRFFDLDVPRRFAYLTLGLLFVNVSIGGTLTPFAAPPVLMVAAKWNWGTSFMLQTFGWRAAASCLASAFAVALVFRRELSSLPEAPPPPPGPPFWITALHVGFLGAVVLFGHHPDILFGVFMIFLGLTTATRAHQDPLKLKEGLLVGFFLAGLVTLGSLQSYWLRPLIETLGGAALFFGATGLTALTDNAALTYLGSLVEGIRPELQYALVAGAVCGGGLTVIANAPNPAGAGILKDARSFGPQGLSPLGLLAGSLFPTVVSIVFYWLLPHP
jgi:hypothetical protein